MNNHSNHNIVLKGLLPVASLLLFLSFFTLAAYSFSSGNSDFNLQDDKTIRSSRVRSSRDDNHIASRPDTIFETIQEGPDIWSWNNEIIRRYQKSTDTWTYYWAPIKYAQLEIQWDQKARRALYFLDGNQITADRAQAFTRTGSGLPVGGKVAVGDPQFCLQIGPSSPEIRKKGKKSLLKKKGIQRLKNRYQQKYQPECWQFSALAVTDSYIWAAVRSIPGQPESIHRFILPNGFFSPRHFRESTAMPIQGGILRIDKDTGEYIRYTEKNGLPERLLCRPLSDESLELPHFLAFHLFPQEVVDIEPLEDGRLRFTTRSNQQVFYDSEQGKWEDAQ